MTVNAIPDIVFAANDSPFCEGQDLNLFVTNPDPNAIYERFENEFDGTLSLAIKVQRMVNAESSGKAYSYIAIPD